MVNFNFNQPIGERTWTVTTEGDAEDYMRTIRALLRVLASQNPDMQSQEDNYDVFLLIEALLPDEKQLKC